jgi:quinol monooxygenase YgiN
MYLNDAFWSIIPGNEAKAYAALGALAAQIEKDEPDTWMYLIHTPNLDPGVNTFPMPGPEQVGFVEGYKDRDAFHTHANSPILKEFFAKNGAYFLNMYGSTVPFMMVQTLEMIDGFIRPGADVMTAWQVEARWVMKPGCREKVKQALKGYVNDVRTQEPDTLMYTVSVADTSEQ